MSQPTFTVVTPTRNRRGELERTICSVLDQGYDGVRHVVADFGSTDGTMEMCGLYGDCATRLAFDATTPVAAAINEALRGDTSDFVGVLPAGDVYLPFALQEVAGAAAGRPWLIGRSVRLNAKLASTAPLPLDGRGDLSALLRHAVEPAPLACCFFTRDTLATHGAFDESLLAAFDFEYQCRLLARGVTAKVSGRPLVGHCNTPSADGTLATLTRGLEMVLVAHRYAEALHVSERPALWKTCADRRRVYALAAAELRHARRFALPTADAEQIALNHITKLLGGGEQAAAA